MTNASDAAVQQIVADIAGKLDTSTLIDRVRHSLEIPPQGVDENTVRIDDALQAALVNELIAQAEHLHAVIKAATADRDAVKELLEELLGDKEILRVHNAEVFTYKYQKSRILNQSFIKSRFPDIEGNEDFYKTTESRRALFV